MTEDIVSVTSRIGAFESLQLIRPVRRRIMGRWRILLVAAWPIFIVLIVLTIVLTMMISGDDVPLRIVLLGALTAASVACFVGINRIVTRKMQQEWLERGVPAEAAYTFSVLPEGLQVTSEIGSAVIRWPFINEVMLVDGRLLLFSTVTAIGISRESFESEVEEQAFVRAVLQHLDVAARTRSRKAANALGLTFT